MKKTDVKTTTYTYTKEYFVDIMEDDENYGAYLYDKDSCIKMLMFECPKEQQTKEEFFEIVKATIDGYIEEYEIMCWETENGTED